MTILQKNQITLLIVHHTAGPDKQTVDEIKQEHIEKGYSDIGYHKIIDQAGGIHQGRPDDIIGAQALDANHCSLGIACIGNFMKKPLPGPQKKTLVQCLVTLCKRHSLKESAIIGHRDVSVIFKDPSVATLCPGDMLYKDLPNIRKEVAKYL